MCEWYLVTINFFPALFVVWSLDHQILYVVRSVVIFVRLHCAARQIESFVIEIEAQECVAVSVGGVVVSVFDCSCFRWLSSMWCWRSHCGGCFRPLRLWDAAWFHWIHGPLCAWFHLQPPRIVPHLCSSTSQFHVLAGSSRRSTSMFRYLCIQCRTRRWTFWYLLLKYYWKKHTQKVVICRDLFHRVLSKSSIACLRLSTSICPFSWLILSMKYSINRI